MEEKKKTDSRKFIVWIVWLSIAVITAVIDVAVVLITKEFAADLVSLTEKVLSWFFAISMMYLGMNVGQKAAFAISDALTKKTDEEEECQ